MADGLLLVPVRRDVVEQESVSGSDGEPEWQKESD